VHSSLIQPCCPSPMLHSIFFCTSWGHHQDRIITAPSEPVSTVKRARCRGILPGSSTLLTVVAAIPLWWGCPSLSTL
jgi:hypothetical protein